MIFLYFCLSILKSLSQMAFYFSNLILQTACLKYKSAQPIPINKRATPKSLIFPEKSPITPNTKQAMIRFFHICLVSL
ncbi:hypothetical protein FMM69_01265 [Lactobacillus murinus]|nr:hypothetical protein [Ligilactobacillus murinus]